MVYPDTVDLTGKLQQGLKCTNCTHSADTGYSINNHFMQNVIFLLKDVNPFDTLSVGAWDSGKINHFNLINLPFVIDLELQRPSFNSDFSMSIG